MFENERAVATLKTVYGEEKLQVEQERYDHLYPWQPYRPQPW